MGERESLEIMSPRDVERDLDLDQVTIWRLRRRGEFPEPDSTESGAQRVPAHRHQSVASEPQPRLRTSDGAAHAVGKAGKFVPILKLGEYAIGARRRDIEAWLVSREAV